MSYQTNFIGLHKADKINLALESLPVATEMKIQTVEGDKIEKHKAILVDGRVIDVPTTKYKLVQHKEAFRPVIEGLTVSGVKDFEFSTWADDRRANLVIYVGEAEDGVKFGFRLRNSYDRSCCISYGMKAVQKTETVQIVEKTHVLVWGYRQVCSNGQVMKVPLKTCKYLDSVTVTRIKELLSERFKIVHMGDDIYQKIENIQYVTEAFLLLKNPLNRMIIDAKNIKVSRKDAMKFIEKYATKRRMDKFMELYGREEQTLWGLFNAMTFYASHMDGLRESLRERVLHQASDMLAGELMPELEAKASS